MFISIFRMPLKFSLSLSHPPTPKRRHLFFESQDMVNVFRLLNVFPITLIGLLREISSSQIHIFTYKPVAVINIHFSENQNSSTEH